MKYYKYSLIWNDTNTEGLDPSYLLNDGVNNYVPIFYTGDISNPYDNNARIYVMLEDGEIDPEKIKSLPYEFLFTEVSPEEILEASGE